jgi:hypothetical protein
MTALAAGAIADVVTLRAQTIGTFTWSRNGEKFEVSCRGDVEFADDDLDVKSFAPGSVLRTAERRRSDARSLAFAADAAGNIARIRWSSRGDLTTRGQLDQTALLCRAPENARPRSERDSAVVGLHF